MAPIRCHIFLPAFNAERILPQTLEKLRCYLPTEPRISHVTIINDGSTDQTASVFEQFIKTNPNPSISLLSLPQNVGKGGAITRAIREKQADATHVLFTDIDLPYGTAAIQSLLNTIINTDPTLIAIGSRKNESKQSQYSPYRRVMSHLFRLFIPTEVRGIKDTQCGCKLFGAKAASVLFSRVKTCGWVFDIELLLIAQKRQFRIIEVPVTLEKTAYSFRGGVSIFHHSFAILRDLARIRFYRRTKLYDI